MTDPTPAQELRAGAAKLREIAKDATRGPWVAYATLGQRNSDGHAWTLTRPYCNAGSPERCEPDCGDTVLTTGAEGCENDNVREADARWMELVHPGLAEPLAALLDEVARQYDMPPCDHPEGTCNVCERRDDFVYALETARTINGGVR